MTLKLNPTGERYLAHTTNPKDSYEHIHRYLFALGFVENKIVLDIACGEGYGASILSKKAQKVIGVDIDKETIAYAKDKYKIKNVEFHVGSVSSIPVIGENVFDVIVSNETIEHVSIKDQELFLQEVKRLLKPDGLFIVSTPNKLTYSDIPKNKNPFHIKEFYEAEFDSFLKNYFTSVKTFGQKVYSGSQIWPLNESSQIINEHLIEHSTNGFQQTDKNKECLYFVSLCSEKSINTSAISQLTDTSNHLDYLYNEQIKRTNYHKNQLPRMHAKLYLNFGKGFSRRAIIKNQINKGEKSIEFNISGYNPIKEVRFDPIDNAVGIILKSIVITHGSGKESTIDEFSTNACYMENNLYIFASDDPQIYQIDTSKYNEPEKITFNIEYLTFGIETLTLLNSLFLPKINQLDVQNKLIESQRLSIRDIKEKLKNIENSWSWRITRPLRSFRPRKDKTD